MGVGREFLTKQMGVGRGARASEDRQGQESEAVGGIDGPGRGQGARAGGTGGEEVARDAVQAGTSEGPRQSQLGKALHFASIHWHVVALSCACFSDSFW